MRKVKDAKDLSTNELIYFKGHAKATYMSDGSTVEDTINNICSGGSGETGPQGPQGEQGPKGEDGVGIASVVQTTTSSADGGSNVMTVTLSDGKTSTFTVKNGSKGSQGEQGPKGDKGDKGDAGANGTNGKDGADGEDGATFTPSVDANGNLSWTNNKGLSNPPTVNIKGPKGDSGEGGGSSGGGGVAYEREFHILAGNFTLTLQPNKFYCIETSSGGGGFEGGSNDVIILLNEDIDDTICNEYNFIIAIYDNSSVSLPDDIIWANGEAPQFENEKAYHISIVDHYAVFAEFNEVW